MRSIDTLRGVTLAALLCTAVPAAADDDPELEALRSRVDALARQNAELQRTVQTLGDDVRAARDDAETARARTESLPPVAAVPGDADPLLSAPLGRSGARLQLLDVSLDVIWAAGGSTARDEDLQVLQGGNHDPRQRGFSLPQIELSFLGAVDPYFTGEAHLLYFLDSEGESRFEIEEAFARTMQLPWGLHERGFQLELGTFLTEFGRHNPTHAHAWSWQDQPVILTRLFGEDGMRGPGVSLGWLAPVDWYSEVFVGAQTAKGETMVSFLANDEVFEERPIGGRPFAAGDTRNPGDLVYHARWVNGFDVGDTVAAQVGVSGLYGGNATGGSTLTYGLDWVVKWLPLVSDRGWPYLTFEGEILRRDYHADAFTGCAEPEDEGACDEPVHLGSDTLHDWGGYTQLLWGFRRAWSAGLRYEYATGSGASVGPYGGRSEDPFRDDRHRVSPLLEYQPTEFSRLRLQYNYDRFEHGAQSAAHSVWLGLEIALGSHPAHGF